MVYFGVESPQKGDNLPPEINSRGYLWEPKEVEHVMSQVVTAQNYRLIDSGGFRKLEQIGPYKLIRPSLPAVWPASKPELWQDADAEFIRRSGGDGEWRMLRSVPDSWSVAMGAHKLTAKLTGFGHVGLFPEHHDFSVLVENISSHKGEDSFRLLNLFAYTGAVSLAAAACGAKVVHVDGSKSTVGWAQENARLSGLVDAPIRWISDDVRKFVKRELKRGHKYDGIVLDPPSFGRGTKGEVWKIDDHLWDLMVDLAELLSSDACFVQLSAHSPGYTPMTLQNLLSPVQKIFSGHTLGFETGLVDQFSRQLPCGACAVHARHLPAVGE